MNIKALTAEFIGTFTLIFIGAGAVAIGKGGLIGAALAHGLVVIAFAYSYGHISGTHINPAVTVSMMVGKQMKLKEGLQYIVVQVAGGVVGAMVLSFVLSGLPETSGLGATVPAEGVSLAQTFILEMLLTFLLVNTIFNTAVSGKGGNLAPIAIGLTLVPLILMGGPLTGASLNPARSIGPALFSNASTALSSLWIYLVAPCIGGSLAALLYTNLLSD